MTTSNPFYLELYQEVMDQVKRWEIHRGDIIAVIGGGNLIYSLAMAKLFPLATVLHMDMEEDVNYVVSKKGDNEHPGNHQILPGEIDDIKLEKASLRALVCIHALYTIPNPKMVLRKMYNWLEPGGYSVLVDPGRSMNVLDWQLALSWYFLRQNGLSKTLKIFWKGKEFMHQNTIIRELQQNNVFWTHSHKDFCREVQNAGFEILYSKICFRGVSDFVVARKPEFKTA